MGDQVFTEDTQKISSNRHRIFKDIYVYGFGGIFSKGLSFLLLPFYTRIFSVQEYGMLELLTLTGMFVACFFTLGLDSAQSYFFFAKEKDSNIHRGRLISSILQLRIILGVILMSLMMVLFPKINKEIFNSSLPFACFVIAIIDAFFVQLMSQAIEVQRLKYNPANYIKMIFMHQLVANATAILLVNICSCRLTGYFVGMLGGSIVTSMYSWLCINKELKFYNDINYFKKLLRFGAPLVIGNIGMYAIQSVDRWFIMYYLGEYELGKYAVVAKFSLMFSMGVEIFRKAWWPIAMEAVHSGKDKDKSFIANVAAIYVGVFSVLAVGVILVSPLLFKFFVAKIYADVYPLLSVMIWQGVFWGFYSIGSLGIWKKEKTAVLSWLLVGFSTLGIFLGNALVKKYGIYGAAFSSVSVYLLWNILVTYISENKWRVGYNYINITMQLVLGFSSAMVYLLMSMNLITSNKGCVLITIIFLILIFMLFKNATNLRRKSILS